MIPSAETLRKIQVEHGVTGSFKDRILADWLQKHNPTEEEYEKVLYNIVILHFKTNLLNQMVCVKCQSIAALVALGCIMFLILPVLKI